MELENCVGLVTGGNRGIGEAFVRALVEAKARKVYIGSRDPAAAMALAKELGDRVQVLRLDVTQQGDIDAAARECPDVSLLINNAGLFTNHTFLSAPDLSSARTEMEVNYFGPLAMSRAFAPILAKNGGGAIVNVLSAGALSHIPNMGGYSPSKSAARFLSTGLRAELAGQGTHVAALVVGSVDTRMAAHVQGKKENPADIARVGLRAVTHKIDELDTDRMATEVRAALALDPKGFEKRMAKMLTATVIRTGK